MTELTKEQKLYFKDENSAHCYPLDYFIHDAKINEEKTITLLEAVPSDIDDFIWCTYYGEPIERNDCKKSQCSQYTSKSGRGKCANKGNLYNHGDKIEVEVIF
jgi:hypothetical protein